MLPVRPRTIARHRLSERPMKRSSNSLALLIAACAAAFALGAAVRDPLAQAPDPAINQLTFELATLRSRVAQLEGRSGAAPALPGPALQALQAKVDLLAQAVQVSGAAVVIRAPGSVSIEGGSHVALRSAGAMRIESGGALEMRANGAASLAGSTVALNGGKRRAAAAGSRVADDRIADGSPTVLVP
jgi:hypothetical protein